VLSKEALEAAQLRALALWIIVLNTDTTCIIAVNHQCRLWRGAQPFESNKVSLAGYRMDMLPDWEIWVSRGALPEDRASADLGRYWPDHQNGSVSDALNGRKLQIWPIAPKAWGAQQKICFWSIQYGEHS
jgi:hypothetical protein